MKILNEGKKMPQWWEGRVLTCIRCKRSVKLEFGDNNRADWIGIFVNPTEVRVQCPCGCAMSDTLHGPAARATAEAADRH